jgi:hypothetical protein
MKRCRNMTINSDGSSHLPTAINMTNVSSQQTAQEETLPTVRLIIVCL